MRTHMLIPLLALMLSLILAGCAQQSHHPALVLDSFETVSPGGNTIFGGGFEIPGLDLNPVPGEGSCHVEVRLLRVHYDGSNVGPLWELHGEINRTPWSYLRELEHGRWNDVNLPILEYESKSCLPHLFLFEVRAKQVREPRPSEEGSKFAIAGIECPTQGAKRKFEMLVEVCGEPWPRLFRCKHIAELTFEFTIKTICRT
ncbi:MAG: hypothetical protein JXM79_24360 [Sedimentisphaerales bacterium]|nr:hypothetical protein [Sedimentisphaerales bacterium]